MCQDGGNLSGRALTELEAASYSSAVKLEGGYHGWTQVGVCAAVHLMYRCTEVHRCKSTEYRGTEVHMGDNEGQQLHLDCACLCLGMCCLAGQVRSETEEGP